MDTKNPSQGPSGGASGAGGEATTIDTADWRTQLHPYSRGRIVNKIMDTLKRNLPVSGQEGLRELKKIAIRFEEKIYAASTSQSNYLQRISLKLVLMETKSLQQQQQSNATNMQQNQLIAQQNTVGDMQQQQQQQQQELTTQQSNLSNMHQQQQQNNQHPIHMLRQTNVPVQQQSQPSASNLLQSQGQQSQSQPKTQTQQPPQ